MTNVYIDTETCGLTGPAVLLQYQFDDGPIVLHELWRVPIKDTLAIIDKICECNVVGFNLAFDWFQLIKIYNMFRLHHDHDAWPEWVDFSVWEQLEKEAMSGPCLKPASALDLMLHARKTHYQCTMERSDIRIRRVPTQLAYKLAEYMEDKIQMSEILFARRKKKTMPKWAVYDVERQDGTIDKNFKDVVLKFRPSVALKALAQDALGVKQDDVLLFQDIEVPKYWHPEEVKYAPYSLAKRGRNWPDVIEHHILHWQTHELARKYAGNDIIYTRGLYEHFGSPPHGDDDSVLACAVAACRFRGYAIDATAMQNQVQAESKQIGQYPLDPRRARTMLLEHISPIEQVGLKKGTSKAVLEEIASWENQPCPFGKCDECNQTGVLHHPAGKVAKGILESRKAKKRIEMYDKLIMSGRLFASFKVIGTLSGRMSGADGLNPQGIPHLKAFRASFPLADGNLELHGGDFEAFEVTLADAAYGDEKLRSDLLTKGICPGCKGSGQSKGKTCNDCNGAGEANQKIHALFAMALFPGKTYREVIESKGSAFDMYDLGKRGIFAMMYGGNAQTLVNKLGVSLEVAIAAENLFSRNYPGVGRARKLVFDKFCSMRQDGGIGSKVTWTDPSDYIESLFGFRRYFTLENKICKVLFDLAQKPPQEWRSLKIKVMRRDREQTASGALQSALFAAAFGIQASNMRAAANHVIQSSGATITKAVQRRIWNIQPTGSHDWKVQPMNIHDEILNPCHPEVAVQVKNAVNDVVEHYRKTVPLLSIGWQRMTNWSEK